MSKINRFEDLEIWQKARCLCNEIYVLMTETGLSKDYALKDQLNGSSGSVMDNIAEGFERGGKKEFIQFLYISKASAGEARSQLYRVYDRKFITEEQFNDLSGSILEISKQISKFIDYLKKTEYKGDKFR
ncbi:MAG TPA: four helix bundle protein [Bacteroidales bacterium]|nr:four helix bundle protein [Bacteroidales bacterium]